MNMLSGVDAKVSRESNKTINSRKTFEKASSQANSLNDRGRRNFSKPNTGLEHDSEAYFTELNYVRDTRLVKVDPKLDTLIQEELRRQPRMMLAPRAAPDNEKPQMTTMHENEEMASRIERRSKPLSSTALQSRNLNDARGKQERHTIDINPMYKR